YFNQAYMDKVDKRTSLIIVGDGRNNYKDPQVEIFKKMARRSLRTIWINPEAEYLWGTGDSDMHKYAPYCDDILKAGTLKELSIAYDQMLL
ncbi:MAG: VWA domain-containing protein, partial [Chloroflexota bacterium]